MSAWDELKKIREEIELKELVRKFVREQLEEVGGLGSGNSDAEGDVPEKESEVEGTY